MKSPVMTRIQRLRLRILEVDPSFLALRMSGCIVVSMIVVAGVMTLIGKAYPLPRPAYVLALIATMQGTLQVNDRTESARATTRIYAVIASFVAIAAMAAAHDSLRIINILLVIIVFAASYAARFGTRWRAVGVFAFMCATVAAFLQEDERDLWSAAAALVISAAVVHVLRHFIMPDDPAREFRRLVAAALSVSKQLRRVAASAMPPKAASIRAGKRQMADLHLVTRTLGTDIRACQASLPLEVPDQHSAVTAITLRLLDLHFAAETLVARITRRERQAADYHEGSIAKALQDVQDAEGALNAAVATLPPTFPAATAGKAPPAPTGILPRQGEWLRDQTLRQSLQVTLACALAAVVGEAVSGQRWFWAVIAAFMIFNNTKSGTAVAIKGLDRAWGTAIGIVIGIALATLTHNHLFWLSAALAISIFATFFIARVSYVAMSLLLTIALSLIYGLIGIFTPELLVLRLEETAVGVASGMLAALLLLPISIQQQATTAMNALLSALGDLLLSAAETPEGSEGHPLALKATAVDHALEGVLTAFAPLRTAWSFGTMLTSGRDVLRQAQLMTYTARRLERSIRHHPPTPDEIQAMRALGERLKAAAGAPASAEARGTSAPTGAAANMSGPDDMTASSLAILTRTLDKIETERHAAP